MRYSRIDRMDLEISQMTVGTWAIGGDGWGDVNEKDSIAAIHAMIDNGVNFIDTAIAYNEGESEKVVGKAIKGKRDKLIVASKGGVFKYGNHMVKDGSYDNMVTQCNRSLQNLQTDYIDIYFVHWPDFNTNIEETFSAMNDLRKAGKIRFIGVSNFTVAQVVDAETFADISMVQPPYSMVNRSQENFMKWTHDHGIGTMTYGSLGAGILTGAIRTLPQFNEGDYRRIFYDYFAEPKFSKIMKLLETLDEIAAQHKIPVSQVVINWSTQKYFVDTAITGVRNIQEANENCACMSWQLNDAEIKHIDDVIDATLGNGNKI